MSEIPERLARIETKIDMLIDNKKRVDSLWDLKNKAFGALIVISGIWAFVIHFIKDALASILK